VDLPEVVRIVTYRRASLYVVALLAASPGTLCAQTLGDPWSLVNAARGAIVHVLPDEGAEVSGRLLRVDAGSLVLLVEGSERRFEQSRVRRIDKRGDRLRNGAIIGAGVGAVSGLLAALISDCPGKDPGGSCVGARAAGFALSVGVYSALGVGIDALAVGRTNVYESPATSSRQVPDQARGFGLVRLGVRW
jgi:hypothetical protein